MANPLYNMFGGNAPMNPMAQLVRDAKAFKKSFTGNPKDEVQRLLNSGQLSQADFNSYSQIAQQVIQAMGNDI
jgi:hypothetical protein